MSDQNRHLLALSAQIVAAHTGHNQIGIDTLSTVIRQVYNTLADLDPVQIRALGCGPTHSSGLRRP